MLSDLSAAWLTCVNWTGPKAVFWSVIIKVWIKTPKMCLRKCWSLVKKKKKKETHKNKQSTKKQDKRAFTLRSRHIFTSQRTLAFRGTNQRTLRYKQAKERAQKYAWTSDNPAVVYRDQSQRSGICTDRSKVLGKQTMQKNRMSQGGQKWEWTNQRAPMWEWHISITIK